MSAPQTKIYICNDVGLTNEYKHTIFFSDQAEQTAFFQNKVAKTFVDYAHARKNWSLKVAASFSTASSWSYLFFQNPNDRVYYYFITDVQYISDTVVELALEMDVMQTYFFDYNLSPCFVEREHSSTDQIGDNTVEEGLELGTMIGGQQVMPEVFNKKCLLIMSTVDIVTDGTDHSDMHDFYGGTYDGVYSGCGVFRVKEFDDVSIATTISGLFDRLKEKTDAIVSMWIYPEQLVKVDSQAENFPIALAMGSNPTDVTYTANRPTSIDGYTPKNNKLFTHPFVYLYAYNHLGNSAIYHYEKFDGGYIFKVSGSIYPDGGIFVHPLNYKGVGNNYDEGISVMSLPTCPYTSDTYKIWLAQNQSQRAIQTGASAVSGIAGGAMMIAGVFTANPILMASGAGLAYSGVSGVAAQLAQQKDMERQPPQAHGNTSTTLNASMGQLGVSFMQKTITAERAKIIDEYFTMYGYATKRVKIPNRNARKSFTYTKTLDCHISGNITTADRNKIESIYNKGITFWNKTVTVGDYFAVNEVKG